MWCKNKIHLLIVLKISLVLEHGILWYIIFEKNSNNCEKKTCPRLR